MVATVCTLAWIASLFQDGCDFARVEGPVVERLIKDGGEGSGDNDGTPSTSSSTQTIPPWLEFGIGAYRSPRLITDTDSTSTSTSTSTSNSNEEWETSFDEPCQLYPSDFQDAPWTTSRALAFLALVLGGGGTLFVLLAATCLAFSKATWRWTGYELCLASLCQTLSVVVWFQTSICTWNSCRLFWGSQADIAAAALWFLGGLFMVCRYPTPITKLQEEQELEEEDDGIIGEEEEDQYVDNDDVDEDEGDLVLVSSSNEDYYDEEELTPVAAMTAEII
jgi:hypothetical protein